MSEKIRPKTKKQIDEIKDLESGNKEELKLNESSSGSDLVLIKEELPQEKIPYEKFPSSKPKESKKDKDIPLSQSSKLTLEPFPKEVKIENQDAKSKEIKETIDALDSAKVDALEKLVSDYEKLSELEKEIITIAKTVLKKKKYKVELNTERVEMMSPLVEQLYSKCIAKLTHTRGFSKELIFSTIQQLKAKYWIVTDQRRTRYEILNSPILKNVLKFIQDNPGTHARDNNITIELGITRNPFIKHVMVLEAFDLIRTKKIGRTQNYFIKDVPEIFDDFVVLFTNPLVSQMIILLMKEHIGLSEIARRLGCYHGAIQYHVKNLITKNILTKIGKDIKVNIELIKKYNELYKVPPFHLFF